MKKCEHGQKYSYYSFPGIFGTACKCCGIENVRIIRIGKDIFCIPCSPIKPEETIIA